MNSKSNGTSVPVSKFSALAKSLTARMQDANQKVGVLADSEAAGAEAIATVRAMNGWDKNAAAMVKALDDAENAANSDPLVRYEWIKAQIAKLSLESAFDPDPLLRLLALARASKMPKSEMETRPLFVSFRKLDEAQAYADQQAGRGLQPLSTPVLYRKEGSLRMDGTTYLVPNGQAERQAFFQLRKALATAAESIISILEDECFFDLEKAVEWIVKTFPGALLVTASALHNKHSFKKTGDALFRSVEQNGFVRSFKLSREQVLLLPNRPENQALIERLVTLAGHYEALEKGAVSGEVSIIEKLRSGEVPVISRQDFLSGITPGQVAVRRNWKKGDKSFDCTILLVRSDDGSWRVRLYNWAAAQALLQAKDGRGQRFTWFTSSELPAHLETFVRTGKEVLGPEDVDLVEETAPAAVSDTDHTTA